MSQEKRQEAQDELANLESIAPEEPQKQILITNRATPEKLIQLCASGSDRGILLKADEMVGIIAQTEKPGSEGLREFYAEAMTVFCSGFYGFGPFPLVLRVLKVQPEKNPE